MKSLSAPILGDEAYGGQKSDRLYLHAHGLGFQLGDQCYQWFLAPRSGEAFSTPEFTSAIKTLREMGGNGC